MCDHNYAFKITPADLKAVFTDLLPETYLPSYNWINVGIVVPDEGAKLNPLHSILKTFNEDDLIVDTSWVELLLAQQLLSKIKMVSTTHSWISTILSIMSTLVNGQRILEGGPCMDQSRTPPLNCFMGCKKRASQLIFGIEHHQLDKRR